MIPDAEKWMRNNYPHMSNATCGIYLGVHPRTVVRMARELGLKKTPEFIRSCRQKPLKATKTI